MSIVLLRDTSAEKQLDFSGVPRCEQTGIAGGDFRKIAEISPRIGHFELADPI
jgi:hypothetical protein